MRCPDDLKLQSFFDGELKRIQQYFMTKHLAKCEACVNRLSELEAVVTRFNQELPKVKLPQVELIKPQKARLVRLTWVTAGVCLLMITSGIIWHRQQQQSWSAEGELLDQYITVYLEN